ncbi:hypothetical protein GCM10027299_57020 [Larkinella ripae]
MPTTFRIFYSLAFVATLACQSEKTGDKTPPNAYRDLLVDRMVWKKKEANNSKAAPTNVHQFTLTNTSDSYLYRQIEVRFDYFDSTYHKISSSTHLLDQPIGPRAALSVGEIPDGPVVPAAKSATVTIVDAKAQPTEPEK